MKNPIIIIYYVISVAIAKANDDCDCKCSCGPSMFTFTPETGMSTTVSPTTDKGMTTTLNPTPDRDLTTTPIPTPAIGACHSGLFNGVNGNINMNWSICYFPSLQTLSVQYNFTLGQMYKKFSPVIGFEIKKLYVENNGAIFEDGAFDSIEDSMRGTKDETPEPRDMKAEYAHPTGFVQFTRNAVTDDEVNDFQFRNGSCANITMALILSSVADLPAGPTEICF